MELGEGWWCWREGKEVKGGTTRGEDGMQEGKNMGEEEKHW